MENPKNMKRKREAGRNQSDVKVHSDRKKKHVHDSNATKTLKENNHAELDSKSDTASKKLKLKLHNENNIESKTDTSAKRKRDRRKRNTKVLKKKRREMDNLKSEGNVTEKGKVHVKTDSIHLKTEEKPVQIPRRPEDFSSNWEKLKQKLFLPPSKSKKHASKKKVENVEPEKPPDIWFDDVDESLLDIQPKQPVGKRKKNDKKSLVKEGTSSGLTKAVAMDCEFVGVGSNSRQDMLARVSLVNQFGHCIYDTFVKPQEEVTDYRTWVSGVREKDMLNGVEFSVACKKAAEMIKGRILVGHAIKNDLKVLYLSHPRKLVRDTSKYKPFRAMFNGKTPSLKKLTAKVLDVAVQEGEHSSIQDAQATMRLYTMYKQKWEKDLALQNPRKLKHLKKMKDLQNEPLDGKS
ncbi:RNA exonuclease 4-like isoform X2 [Mizuhopecten yessoensis]|uniref:RNA exonuclease 4 n=2 Tax=Mizuhopecten yessoensis TaxID=6573 RepID=A0A210QRS9_MIZYE|nr:RNA exonuclease 4-like isoform X2 [Mizuhopecten yessoensis]XP_021351571.1 RNA exonuclease 4-like isoform X2 [Mizuhopecten yessoensis]OWF51430.1 RNA exonuclease 4 [Mizuhopecten yessoensis]